MLKCFIRVDASVLIGTGHVMRCLSLAKSLVKYGYDCVFVCRDHEGGLVKLIHDQRFRVILLPFVSNVLPNELTDNEPLQKQWLGVSVEEDAKQTIEILPDNVDLLIVDHYSLDIEWETLLREKCRKVVVIDDLANRRHNCDILIDQNISRSVTDYDGLVNKNCRLLIGTRFLLLREDFVLSKNKKLGKKNGGKGLNVLIFMGGADNSGDLSLKICSFLNKKNTFPDSFTVNKVFVLLPSQNSLTVREKLSEHPLFEVLVYVNNMANFLVDIDLCFSAGGFFMYELATMNIPAIIIPQSEIQKQVASVLATKTAMVVLDNSEVCEQKIQLGLKHLLRLQERRCIDFDGLGLQRVCQHILNLEER